MLRQPVLLISKKAVLLFVLAASFFAVLTLFPRFKATETGYMYLSQLPSDFVQEAQLAQEETGLAWQLLAAYCQLGLEKEIFDSYPPREQLIMLAKNLVRKPEASHYQILAGSADGMLNAKEIKLRERQLKATAPLFSAEYSFPLPAGSANYVDTWHADRDGGKRKHQGTDLFAEEGTPVYAVVDGMVERKGHIRLGGKRVGLRGKDGLYYYYAHLARYAPGLKEGQLVRRGDLLGYVGHTGNAQGTPDHLHFGIMTAGGKWFNPYNFLKYWEQQ